MRHGVNKIKFSHGRDSNRNMVSKLAKNFVINAKIETNFKKIKVLKPVIEKMVEKAKSKTEANKNYLLKILHDQKLVDRIYKDTGENFKDKVGGYVRIIRLGIRREDGSETARLEWTRPIVAENQVAKPSKDKNKAPAEIKEPIKTGKAGK